MRKTYWRRLFLIYIFSFVLFYPSLNYFFTHDDFFLLKISSVKTVGQILQFFNIFNSPEGLGMYRPLSMQTFYVLGINVFDLNPFWLHLISFFTFFILIYLVYKFLEIITQNQEIALLSSFLYATSATHFSHLYFLGAYQELLMSVFVIISLICYVKYLKCNSFKYYMWVFIFFVLGVLSKENALVLPLMLAITFLYCLRKKMVKKSRIKKQLLYLLPTFLIALGYMYIRVVYYGLPQGDSYVWDFSTRVVNSIFWFIWWSFNIPEMFVDFIGPGANINPNLFIYWGEQARRIISLFAVVGVSLVFLLANSLKKIKKENILIIYFILWFAVFLLPFIFLPLHKFTYYLTLPLVGVVAIVSLIIELGTRSKIVKFGFLLCWVLLSFTTLNLTRDTHWITRGSETAKKVNEYFENYDGQKTKVVFYDTPDDKSLPWSPAEVVKTTLSEDDYFIVFHPEVKSVKYIPVKENEIEDVLYLESRQFLGY